MNAAPASDKAQLVLDHANAVAILTLSGKWTVQHLPEEERIVFAPVPVHFTQLIINGTALEEADTSGAWLIMRVVRHLAREGMQVEWMGFSAPHRKIITLIANTRHEKLSTPERSATFNFMVSVGRYCTEFSSECRQLAGFFGQCCTSLAYTSVNPRRLRWRSVLHHANEVGINAMPIILLLSFCISLVLGYQGANQLRQFGAMSFTINLVAISMLRDMGVLITAIMAAGRSSSSFAAQIGVMQMNDEVAAMRTLGLDPFELLVLPRILGTLIALPLLTFVADMAGLAGTYFVSYAYLDIPYAQFISRVQGSVNDMTFYIGLMKAPVFALIVSVIGCFHGMQVRSSATELGVRTTSAVVQAIFLIVLADALFSVLFTIMNI